MRGVPIAQMGHMQATNIISTIMTMRASGQTMHRMPLFVWAMLAQSVIIVLAIPVLAG